MKLDEVQALVRDTILSNGGTPILADKVIKDLAKAAEEEKADRAASKGPKTKLQHNVLVSDPEGKLKGLNLIGWVIVTEADAAPQSAHERLIEAANNHNNSKRGRRHPVNTLGEACENLKGKWLKRDNGQKLQIKTRTPIALIAVPNKIG